MLFFLFLFFFLLSGVRAQGQLRDAVPRAKRVKGSVKGPTVAAWWCWDYLDTWLGPILLLTETLAVSFKLSAHGGVMKFFRIFLAALVLCEADSGVIEINICTDIFVFFSPLLGFNSTEGTFSNTPDPEV